MRFAIACAVMLSSILAGCAAAPVSLQPGAEAVRVAKSDPPDNFSEIGPVNGSHGSGCGLYGSPGNYDGAVKDLKNRAFSMGADYVQIMTISEPHGTGGGCYVNRYEINGNAYKQTKPLPSPMPIVNQSEAVDPVARLKELRSLLDSGTITQAEFEQLKARLIKQQ